MTNKKKAKARAMAQKTGMSYAESMNVLNKNQETYSHDLKIKFTSFFGKQNATTGQLEYPIDIRDYFVFKHENKVSSDVLLKETINRASKKIPKSIIGKDSYIEFKGYSFRNNYVLITKNINIFKRLHKVLFENFWLFGGCELIETDLVTEDDVLYLLPKIFGTVNEKTVSFNSNNYKKFVVKTDDNEEENVSKFWSQRLHHVTGANHGISKPIFKAFVIDSLGRMRPVYDTDNGPVEVILNKYSNIKNEHNLEKLCLEEIRNNCSQHKTIKFYNEISDAPENSKTTYLVKNKDKFLTKFPNSETISNWIILECSLLGENEFYNLPDPEFLGVIPYDSDSIGVKIISSEYITHYIVNETTEIDFDLKHSVEDPYSPFDRPAEGFQKISLQDMAYLRLNEAMEINPDLQAAIDSKTEFHYEKTLIEEETPDLEERVNAVFDNPDNAAICISIRDFTTLLNTVSVPNWFHSHDNIVTQRTILQSGLYGYYPYKNEKKPIYVNKYVDTGNVIGIPQSVFDQFTIETAPAVLMNFFQSLEKANGGYSDKFKDLYLQFNRYQVKKKTLKYRADGYSIVPAVFPDLNIGKFVMIKINSDGTEDRHEIEYKLSPDD